VGRSIRSLAVIRGRGVDEMGRKGLGIRRGGKWKDGKGGKWKDGKGSEGREKGESVLLGYLLLLLLLLRAFI